MCSFSLIDCKCAIRVFHGVMYSVKYPDGTLAVDKTEATHGTTGQYTINYTLPAETTGQEGKYKLTVYITGNNTDIQTTSFEVEASI